MSLSYFPPEASLHPHVQFFAVLEEPASVFNNRIILPDPHPALLINMGAPFLWEADDGTQIELPRAFLIGMQTKPLKIRATGACHVLGLNLEAWGMRYLADEHTNLGELPVIPLRGVWQDAVSLLETTLHHRGDIEAVATLMQFIGDLHQRVRPDITAIRAAVKLLASANGGCSQQELAAHCYLSTSQLTRHSKYFTGHALKILARLIRFEATCAGLLHNPTSRLTDLAHQYGYVDQAHFVHEFKSLTTLTPREAKIYVHQLAEDAQFLQLS